MSFLKTLRGALGVGGNVLYNLSGAHDVVDAVHDPGNWKKDLAAAGDVAGFLIPGAMEGRLLGTALGKFETGGLLGHLAGAIPTATGIADNPTDPNNYAQTLLAAAFGYMPQPTDKLVSKLTNLLKPGFSHELPASVLRDPAFHDLTLHPKKIAGPMTTAITGRDALANPVIQNTGISDATMNPRAHQIAAIMSAASQMSNFDPYTHRPGTY